MNHKNTTIAIFPCDRFKILNKNCTRNIIGYIWFKGLSYIDKESRCAYCLMYYHNYYITRFNYDENVAKILNLYKIHGD